MTEWAAPPSIDVWRYPGRPKARMHRRTLAAIAAACVRVRYSPRDPYVRARLAAAYVLLCLFTIGLGIVIAATLQ